MLFRSVGDLSIFGLSSSEVVDVIDTMRGHSMLDCVQLLHFHLGSQIPNIRDIRTAVHEAARMYADLAKEGCAMGFLDLGGGLAVDYDGSHTNYASSRNYTLEEYCTDIVESVMATMVGRIKDYISKPKPNGYQSLHTTVVTKNDQKIGRAHV